MFYSKRDILDSFKGAFSWLFLTRCGLMTPYDDLDLDQDWLRYWPVAWRYQAIAWTNMEFSLVRLCCIYVKEISQRVTKLPFCMMTLKIILLKLLLHLSKSCKPALVCAMTWACFYLHGLNLIPAWISNYTHCNVWDEITYPFLNFNGATVEV